MNHKDVILIAVIFFIGIILRLYSLGTTLPVFVDEAIYVRWAQVMKAEETLRFLPLSDGKQPLFMWLVIPSLKLFSDPLFAGRFISVLSGLGIMIEMGLVSWLLFRSKQVAIITFFLIASSPFLVFFDRKALVDSLLTFWGMGALVLGLLFVRNPRFDLSLLIGGALGGAWLTKTPGEFFFFLLPTVLLVAPKKSLADWKFLLKALSGFLVALIVGFGIYNILRLGPNFHLIGSRNLDYIYSLNEIISHPLTPLISNLEQVGWWLIILMTLPIVILGVIGAYRMLRRMPSKALLLFVWTIGPILIESIFGKVFTARYILFTVPAMLLFGAYGISRVSPKPTILKIAVLILIATPLIWQNYLIVARPALAWLPPVERNGYMEEWTAGYGLREIAAYLKGRPDNINILVGTEGFFGTMPDGLQMYLEGRSNIRVVGLAYPIKDIPTSLNNALGDNEVYLIANKSRFEIMDPPKHGLELVSSFAKPSRVDGSTEILYFYRVKPQLPI